MKRAVIFKRILCIEPLAGTDIRDAAEEACQLAYMESRNLILSFNGVYITVTPSSLGHNIMEEYHSSLEYTHAGK